MAVHYITKNYSDILLGDLFAKKVDSILKNQLFITTFTKNTVTATKFIESSISFLFYI